MKILSIDAWADGTDDEPSWTWNAWYKIGEISKDEFEALDTDAKLIEYMIESGYIKPEARSIVHVEDDQHNIVFQDSTENYQPVFAIEYGNDY